MTREITDKLEYEIDKLSININKCLNIDFSINILQNLSDEDLNEFIKSYIEIINSAKSEDYFKCNYLGDLARAVYPLDMDLAKLCIKKALKYSNTRQMYRIAGECYKAVHDKSFSTKIYKKAIKRCYKQNNTSQLHLLGQSMCQIDVEGYHYFEKWGEKIQAQAKELSDRQKLNAKKIEKEITYAHDTQVIDEIELTPKKFLKKAEIFLMANAKLEKDEILYYNVPKKNNQIQKYLYS